MKRLMRIIPIIMTTVFFLTGLPAVETFAAAEEADLVSAEEQIVSEQPEQNGPSEESEEIIAEQTGEEPEEPLLPADPAAEEPATEEPTDETENTEEITEDFRQEALLAEPVPGGEPTGQDGDGDPQDPDEGLGEGGQDTPDPKEDDTHSGGKENDKPKAGKTALSVTNNTNMFKVVDAYIETKDDGTMELVIALSGTTYSYLFVGTYDEAVQVGYNTKKWNTFFTDSKGRKAFRIPIDKNSSYLPIISISDTYLKKYQDKQCSLARAFYARQMVLDQKSKTLVSGDYETTIALTIKNNVKKISAESASLSYVGGPNNNGYAADLIIKMGNNDYDNAFIGSKKDAAEAEKTVKIGKNKILTLPMKWLSTFGDPDSLVSLIGKKFTVSLRNAEKKTWEEYSFTVKENAGTLTIDIKDKKDDSNTGKIVIPGQKSSKEKQKEQKQQAQATVGGGTGAVDNSTALKDGTYQPDKFSFSGGTGKIVITCSGVEVKDGKAYATLEFRNTKSGVAEFSYVKANGQSYSCSQVGGASVVTIPVELNANTQILGMTTKMSAAHEIAYTIFVYIKGADAKEADDLTKNKDFDEKAPEIAGLESAGEENVEDAQLFKVFNYSDGIRLLEIDMRLADEKTEKDDAEEKKESEDEAETTIIDEETGEEITVAADKHTAQAKLYKGNIVKYLLVPEGVEIPAGLDKETIVLQLPVKSVYAGSEAIRKTMKDLGVDSLITCMEKEDGDIQEAGAFGDLKLRTLVKGKCDVAMIPGDFLEKDKGRETFESQAEDLANLDITLIADRSAAEKTKKAKAEWVKVYGMLFGCEQAAQEAFTAVD